MDREEAEAVGETWEGKRLAVKLLSPKDARRLLVRNIFKEVGDPNRLDFETKRLLLDRSKEED